jgi:hypothetical protein
MEAAARKSNCLTWMKFSLHIEQELFTPPNKIHFQKPMGRKAPKMSSAIDHWASRPAYPAATPVFEELAISNINQINNTV